MKSVLVGSVFILLKSFYVFSLTKASIGMSLLLWQQLSFSSGLLRFCRTYRTAPYLLLELRLRLNLRYWVTRLWKSCLHNSFRTSVSSPVLSAPSLRRRDGQNIFDFFKTLSLSDVSPPVAA